MPKHSIPLLRGTVFALGVAVSLAFGARQALAGPTVCPELAVARCSTTERCQQTCASLGRTGGECRNGCCFCGSLL